MVLFSDGCNPIQPQFTNHTEHLHKMTFTSPFTKHPSITKDHSQPHVTPDAHFHSSKCEGMNLQPHLIISDLPELHHEPHPVKHTQSDPNQPTNHLQSPKPKLTFLLLTKPASTAGTIYHPIPLHHTPTVSENLT